MAVRQSTSSRRERLEKECWESSYRRLSSRWYYGNALQQSIGECIGRNVDKAGHRVPTAPSWKGDGRSERGLQSAAASAGSGSPFRSKTRLHPIHAPGTSSCFPIPPPHHLAADSAVRAPASGVVSFRTHSQTLREGHPSWSAQSPVRKVRPPACNLAQRTVRATLPPHDAEASWSAVAATPLSFRPSTSAVQDTAGTQRYQPSALGSLPSALIDGSPTHSPFPARTACERFGGWKRAAPWGQAPFLWKGGAGIGIRGTR